jgi:hypothetical protein
MITFTDMTTSHSASDALGYTNAERGRLIRQAESIPPIAERLFRGRASQRVLNLTRAWEIRGGE